MTDKNMAFNAVQSFALNNGAPFHVPHLILNEAGGHFEVKIGGQVGALGFEDASK